MLLFLHRRRKKANTEPKPKRRLGGARGHKLILMVGEEGAVLLHLAQGKVVERFFSPAPDAPETKAMEEAAARRPGMPLLFLFDTADQTYVQQQLPPVSMVSVHKLVGRRLARDFPADHVKGFFTLGRETEGRKDWQVMLVSLQQAGPVREWLSVTGAWSARCAGLYLLPVEMAEVSRTLYAALTPNTPSPAWQLLVSYNKISGVRQVVLNNGKLVITRLGHPAVNSKPDTIAASIEQEVGSTLEYMTRLGVEDRSQVHVVMVLAEDICHHIQASTLQLAHLHCITPHQAATLLSLEGATQPTDRFGDALIGAAVGGARRMRLRMQTPELGREYVLAKALLGQRVIAALLGGFLLWQTGDALWGVTSLYSSSFDLSDRRTTQQNTLNTLRGKSSLSVEQLEKVGDMLMFYEAMRVAGHSPVPMLNRLAGVMQPTWQAQSVQWQLKSEGGKLAKVSNPESAQAQLIIALDVGPSAGVDRQALQNKLTDLLNQVKGIWPKHEVKYLALPSFLSDTDQIVGSLEEGAVPAPTSAASTQARLSVSGVVIAPPAEEDTKKGGDHAASAPQANTGQ